LDENSRRDVGYRTPRPAWMRDASTLANLARAEGARCIDGKDDMPLIEPPDEPTAEGRMTDQLRPELDMLAAEDADLIEPATPEADRVAPGEPDLALELSVASDTNLPTETTETTETTEPVETVDVILNREFTWLDFNSRVLERAEESDVPLLERVKFLAIVGSNLDEFTMKRIGGLKHQMQAGVQTLTVDGRTPGEQIVECYERIRSIEERQRIVHEQLMEELSTAGIRIADYQELDEASHASLREHYCENIFPLVTPQTSDPAHPFPFVSNLSLNLLVRYSEVSGATPSFARIKVPIGPGVPRFVRVDQEDVFVPLESVMIGNLDLLFPEAVIEDCTLFRVTRNANAERDEETADDLLALIESEMRDRRFAPIVRLEVAADMPTQQSGMLASELGLDQDSDVFDVRGIFQMRDLMEIANLTAPELHDPPFAPVDHPAFAREDRSSFHSIRDAGAVLVHHPYQSYSTSVERFLRDASRDPKVRAIKMTLYRTDSGSKAIDYLIDAASNGKQVAAVVELKARFEEEANIRWANRLEEAGIHVTYGVVGLKTHCKVILVVRQDYSGLRRYAHIGTGNYNAITSRLYTDFGLFTDDEAIGRDLTELFNYLSTGFKPKRTYSKILPSPKHCKPALLEKIDREIEHQQSGREGLIQIKTNALEDYDITRALYRAAREGVHVDLIVRDSCRVSPHDSGLSDSMRIVGIVGRFLEHSRLYYFRNGGAEEYFMGSADCMKRNLESRVEVLVPVEAENLREELRYVIDALLSDTTSAWAMVEGGQYERLNPAEGKKPRSAQQTLIERAIKQHHAVTRLKRRGVRRTPARWKR
jgi:polyphosphate kinase